eukprot:11839095-Alexandrium_andersonii.AAC.1
MCAGSGCGQGRHMAASWSASLLGRRARRRRCSGGRACDAPTRKAQRWMRSTSTGSGGGGWPWERTGPQRQQ